MRALGIGFGIIVGIVGCGGGGNGNGPSTETAGASGTGACVTGTEGCACYGNGTCNGSLQCTSSLCVALPGAGGAPATNETGDGGTPNETGDGGTPGETGDGGTPGETGDGGATDSTPGQAGSGSTGKAGAPGAGGTPNQGAAGAPAAGTPSAGSPGAGGSTSPSGDTCNNAPATTIDNFATCDLHACDLGGRNATWFSYSDNGINLDFAVRVPPSGWTWQACSAVVIGGPRTSGDMNYAGAGVILNASNPYDVSGYTGVRFRLESDTAIWFGIEMTDGGRFGASVPAANAVVREVSFASLTAQADSSTETKNLKLVKQVIFAPEDPSEGFGFLIGDLSFY